MGRTKGRFFQETCLKMIAKTNKQQQKSKQQKTHPVHNFMFDFYTSLKIFHLKDEKCQIKP